MWCVNTDLFFFYLKKKKKEKAGLLGRVEQTASQDCTQPHLPEITSDFMAKVPRTTSALRASEEMFVFVFVSYAFYGRNVLGGFPCAFSSLPSSATIKVDHPASL